MLTCNVFQDFTSSTSNWLHAVRSGDSILSDDVEEHISKHSDHAAVEWPLTNAKGGDSANPFVDAEGRNRQLMGSTDSDDRDDFIRENLPKIHGAMATLAFVILFPIGGIIIRLANFRGGIWIHVGLQILAWLIALAAVASGIRLAVTLDLFVNSHPIIGMVLAILLVGQPIYGIVHHRKFKKEGQRSSWSYIHLGIGRVVVFLGMVNGGLGLMLAGNTEQRYIIAYSVVAGVLGILYILAIIWGERRRKSTKFGNRGFKSEDKARLINRGGDDSQGLGGGQEGQEMRRLWLNNKNRESQGPEYYPLAVGEGYGDEPRSRAGSRAGSRQPSPSGLYSDHQRGRSLDSRARVSMA
jgi:hypothetical protein